MANEKQEAWRKLFEEQTSKTTEWVNNLVEKYGESGFAELFPTEFGPEPCSYSPETGKVFAAFKMLEPGEVKYLVIGQDPYPNRNLATGVAFLVPNTSTTAQRKSLDNLILMGKLFPAGKEPEDLVEWSKVNHMLLINAALTFERPEKRREHLAEWKKFSIAVIRCILSANRNVVLCAVGRSAERVLLMALKDTGRDIKRGDCYYAHPSPNYLNTRDPSSWNKWSGPK